MSENNQNNAERRALRVELQSLREIVRNARNVIAEWDHDDGCEVDLHSKCGPSERNPDGTRSGDWYCDEGLDRETCETILRGECDCGMTRLREALEVNRG